jgi:RNA polymerase sigma factor (sigma-70 family)
MSSGTLGAILRRLRLVAEQKCADQSDRHLLEGFVTNKDEAAFAALMERHARLVFGVCRSVLEQEQDAEDAFQATFLVLARLASSIRKRDSLASWLHGVALRTAWKARQAMNTRRRKEPQAGTRTPEQPASEAAFRELQAILHEEVGRLTEKYRTPFVLCCLEGKSRGEAAQELGWKEGTVGSRVAQARKLLESRLLRRGVALPAALTAATLAPTAASAAVLVALSSLVARGAVAFATGKVPESVSTGAATLAEGVIRAMFVTKLRSVSGMVLTLALLVSGGGLLACTALQSQPGDSAIVAPAKERAEEKRNVVEGPADPDPRLPAAGAGLEAPLPRGAIVRFGTTRFRPGGNVGNLKLSADGKKLISGGRATGEGVFVWDAVTGKRILWRPLGEEGELSRDGERLFVIESLPSTPPRAKARPPADKGKSIKVVVGAPVPPEVKNALRVYQLSTGKLLQQIDNASRLCRFAVAPDERTLALEYADRDGEPQVGDGMTNWKYKSRLELYDLKTGRVLHRLGEQQPRSPYPGSWLHFSQDGKTLFVIGRESTIKRFDVATGALKPQTAIAGLPFLVGDKTLIVAGNKIWDLEKERLLWTLKGELGATRPGQLYSIYTFTPDCRTVIGSVVDIKPVDGTGSSVVHWDLEKDREIRRLPNHAAYAISLDGKIGFGTDWTGVNGRWFRWDIATGKEVDAVDAPISPPGPVVFSPDGKYVATLDSTSSASKTFDPAKKYFVVRIWDRATGKCLHQISTFLGNLLFFTPDGKTLVYGCGGVSSIFVLDTSIWKSTKRDFEPAQPLVANFPVGLGTSTCVLSPDGKVLATPQALWDWASGKLLGKLEHKYADDMIGQLGPIAFSPDSKQLFCVASLPAPQVHLQVWNVADRKLRSDKVMTDWPKGLVRILQLGTDGKWLAAVWLPPRGPWRGMLRWPEDQGKPIPADWPATMPPMPDADVRVWDAAAGQEKVRLKYPQNENMSDMPALFSPDGKLVVTANYHDEVVHFRDPISGKVVGRFRCGVKGVLSMTFSPDSRVLAVSAKDTTVLLVDVHKVVRIP